MLIVRFYILFAVFFIFTFSTGLAADSPLMSSLTGQVLNRTIDAKDISGLEIELIQSLYNKKTVVSRTKADATGLFSFQGLKAEDSAVYLVSTHYGGVKYFSDPIHLTDNGATPTKLVVYETTDQAPGLYVKIHHIIFEKAESTLQVKEVMVVENPGNRTVIGSREVKPDKKETLRIPLPASAINIRYMPPLNSVLSDSKYSLITTKPLLPGIHQFIFGYTISSPGAKYIFSKPVYLKTNAVSVFSLNKDLRIKSDQLVSKKVVSNSDKPFYQLFGKDFIKGSRITMRLNLSKRSDYFNWIVIALVMFVMGIGIAIPFLRRRLNADKKDRDYPDKKLLPDALASRRRAVIESLAELDDLFESGRLASSAYHQKRNLLLEEAKVLTKKLQPNS